MKNKISILTVIALTTLGSCQKLDRDIVTTLSTEQYQSYFGTISGLLTSVYYELPDGMLYINGNAMTASATDEADFTIDPHPVQLFNLGSWNAVNNPDDVWGKYYRAIRKANELLVSTDKVDNEALRLDKSASGQTAYQARLNELKRWTFEARFLRAYFYFELVKRYGGVPLITRAFELNEDVSQTKRNTLQECINFIVSECDAATPELPPYPALTAYADADMGRATKWAAMALKSRVLLYAASDLFNTNTWAGGYAYPELISLPAGDRNARWKAASDAALAFINARGIVALSTNYKTMFNTFNTNTTPEIILTRTQPTKTNTFEKTNYPVGFNGTGNGGNAPSQDLVDAYEMKPTGKLITEAGSGYDANAPYVNRDPRLALSVGYNTVNYGAPNNRAIEPFTGGLDGLPKVNATRTGYYIRKYVVETTDLTNSGTAAQHSWILFRVPEIYLNYAEALNEWSPGNPDIKIYIDRIRTRTGVAMPGMPVGLSQAQARDRIRNERRVELAFEDHRAWDTRRWMIAPASLGAPLRGMNIVKTGATTYSYTPYVVENRVFDTKMYLYPIPQGEINVSAALFQNPLW